MILVLLWQVWAHISCLNDQMAQHPKRYRYNMEHFMCNLCQQELRDHAAHAASRSEQASPRNGLASQGRKSGMQSAFAAEVSTVLHDASRQLKAIVKWRNSFIHCA